MAHELRGLQPAVTRNHRRSFYHEWVDHAFDLDTVINYESSLKTAKTRPDSLFSFIHNSDLTTRRQRDTIELAQLG